MYYQLIILLLLLLPFGVALGNYFTFAEIRRRGRPTRSPRISALVPARNEERSIEVCVRSLLAQDYPDFEVIVLNDGSDDATGEILNRLREEHPDRLRVIDGMALPEGWVGKNWACHQLSLSADGVWLFFTDADTRHAPESITACMGFAERHGVGFLSGVPFQRTDSFWEEVIIPMAPFLYFAYLPNRWITRRADPRYSAANGQLLLIERGAYGTMGGHAAARSQLVEDVWLGRAAKRAGVRTALAIAAEIVECRMYRSLDEIIAGFSKNLYPGLGYSPVSLGIFLASLLLLHVLPLAFLITASLRGDFTIGGFLLPLAQLLLAGSIRWMLARRFRISARQMLYHPLSAMMAAIIAINSARWACSPAGARWKGRSYGRSSGSKKARKGG